MPDRRREGVMLLNEYICTSGQKPPAPQLITLEQTAKEIYGNALIVYWRSFITVCLIYLIPNAPLIITKYWSESAGLEGLAHVAEILSFSGYNLALAATVIAVSETCLGNRPTVSGSYSHLMRVRGSFITAFLVILLWYATLSIRPLLVWPTVKPVWVFALALFSFIYMIYAIYTSVVMIFVLPVAILEKRGGFLAIQRSVQLS